MNCRFKKKEKQIWIKTSGRYDELYLLIFNVLRWKKKQQNVTQSMVDACILEEISTFLTMVLSQSERKAESALAASGGKRSRHSNEFDDPSHPALTGHDYSQRFAHLLLTV